jgi:hypothetical protein
VEGQGNIKLNVITYNHSIEFQQKTMQNDVARWCGGTWLGRGGSKAEPVSMIRLRVGAMRGIRAGSWLLYIRPFLPTAFYKKITVQ